MTYASKTALLVAAGALLAGSLLSGCDSKPQATLTNKAAVQKYEQSKTLEGLINNDAGPVKQGIIRALSEQGQELARLELTDGPHYSLEIPAGTVLPILLTYAPAANAPEDQRMISVVVHAAASKFDINPLSSRIAKQAKAMGGYTHKNLVQAAEGSGTVPASNKTTAGFRGDPTTQYGGWH